MKAHRPHLDAVEAQLAALGEAKATLPLRLVELRKKLTEDLASPVWAAGLRKGCGHDLTSLILAIPADGMDYEVKCPGCGNVGVHMTTPPGV